MVSASLTIKFSLAGRCLLGLRLALSFVHESPIDFSPMRIFQIWLVGYISWLAFIYTTYCRHRLLFCLENLH